MTKSSHRPAAVAGLFYPAESARCHAQVEQLLGASSQAPIPGLRALIVPHAGYDYSGPVAAAGFRALPTDFGTDRLIAVLGPNHRVPLRGIALDSHSFFSTPMGEVPVATRVVHELAELPAVTFDDAAHAQEHCIEVMLPFLQYLEGEFTLLPALVGQCSVETTARFIEQLQRRGAFILVSSDLSHFHSYSDAQQLDQATSKAILRADSNLQPEQACGCGAINGLNAIASREAWRVRQLARNNSGDSAGDKDRVVGYGAYAYH